MSRDEQLAGIKWLANRLYHPAAFGERMVGFIERLGYRRDLLNARPREHGARPVDRDVLALLGRLRRLGPEEAEMWSRIRRALARRPEASRYVIPRLAQYLQIRHMYASGEIWEPGLANLASPAAVVPELMAGADQVGSAAR